MNRQELVKIVARKLGVEESVVDAVYMSQTEEVSKNLKHPDRNEIFFPNLGTLVFKIPRGADKLITLMSKIVRYKNRILITDNTRSVSSMENRIGQMQELCDTLKWKVSYTTDKYENLRTKYVDKCLSYWGHGKHSALVEELRKQRQYGFNKETDPESKETLE